MRLQRMGILIAYHKALKSIRHVLSFYRVLVSGEKPPCTCTSVSICRLHLDPLTSYIAYLGCLVFPFRNNIVGNKMCHGIFTGKLRKWSSQWFWQNWRHIVSCKMFHKTLMHVFHKLSSCVASSALGWRIRVWALHIQYKILFWVLVAMRNGWLFYNIIDCIPLILSKSWC